MRVAAPASLPPPQTIPRWISKPTRWSPSESFRRDDSDELGSVRFQIPPFPQNLPKLEASLSTPSEASISDMDFPEPPDRGCRSRHSAEASNNSMNNLPRVRERFVFPPKQLENSSAPLGSAVPSCGRILLG